MTTIVSVTYICYPSGSGIATIELEAVPSWLEQQRTEYGHSVMITQLEVLAKPAQPREVSAAEPQ